MTDKPMPDTIWLLPETGEEGSTTWCDDPDPSGSGDQESTPYVRKDRYDRLRKALEEATDLLERSVLGGWIDTKAVEKALRREALEEMK